MIDPKIGYLLVKAARNAIVRSFDGDLSIETIDNSDLNEHRGVFVTLKKHPFGELRGCIGFVSPVPIYAAVQKAALEAAFNDSRFTKLEESELDDVIVEVSVMTEPIRVEPKNANKDVTIGVDGLMIEHMGHNGLLLPQVPVEHGWDIEQFLAALSQKAGIATELIYDKNTTLWKFQCQIFREREPSADLSV